MLIIGPNPTVTESHLRAIEKLNKRLVNSDDVGEDFNLMSRPRVILHDCPLSKRSKSSIPFVCLVLPRL